VRGQAARGKPDAGKTGVAEQEKTMSYVEGFVVPVPTANKEAYRQQAADFAPLVKEFGATRHVEAWGDDVPDGKVTDFKRAVKAKADEEIVFSWFEYPSKTVRNAANEKMRTDPRMKSMGESMPFDGMRMIMGGFTPIVEEGSPNGTGYIDGALIPVPADAEAAYRKNAARRAAAYMENGATRVVEAWGDDVPDGKVTDFKGAVDAHGDEKVVYCWVEWPSKAVRDAAWEKLMKDPRMMPEPGSAPFDGKRMIFGGFAPIMDA
jgi:uncharacterized protein YbaA (DUF1428 family)